MNESLQTRVSELGWQLLSDKEVAKQLPHVWYERLRLKQLAPCDLDELIDEVLANLLGERGFQEDWNLTLIGQRVEAWIDQLNEMRIAWKESEGQR